MPIPPLYKPSNRQSSLPEIYNFDLDKDLLSGPVPPNSFRGGPVQAIPLIFLYKADRETRDDVWRKLQEEDEGSLWPEDVPRAPLLTMPWLRAYTPSIEDAFRIARENRSLDFEKRLELAARPLIFVDGEGVEKGECLIWRWLYGDGDEGKERRDEFARVRIKDAYKLICCAQPDESWFPNVLGDECRVLEPDNQHEDSEKMEIDALEVQKNFTWPKHIPSDFKLQKERPMIISLIPVKGSRIRELITEIGINDRYGEVSIINWTSSPSAASEADIWNIFDQIKPDWPSAAPWGPVFCFFLGSHDLSSENLELLVATRERNSINPSTKPTHESVRDDNGMYLNSEPFNAFWEMWHAAWNPRPYNGSIRYNVLSRPSHHKPFAYITNPEIPIINYLCGFSIFILEPIPPEVEYKFRALLRQYDTITHRTTQFLYVPNGDGTVSGLLRYLESPVWTCYQPRVPSTFVAIDAHTLETLDSGTPSFVVGTEMNAHHYSEEEDSSLASDKVGYAVGRACLEDEVNGTKLVEQLGFAMKGLEKFIGIPDDDPNEWSRDVVRYYWDSWVNEDGTVDDELDYYILV